MTKSQVGWRRGVLGKNSLSLKMIEDDLEIM
jgi:hypothetical protein